MIYFEGEKNNIIVSYNFNMTSIWLQYERGKINKIIIKLHKLTISQVYIHMHKHILKNLVCVYV